jgi:tRNA dimethylallyltransferase
MKMIVIAGITASGKTKLSLRLAQRYNSQIINADSVSFYKELNIGSAKPSKDELSLVKHHLIDIKSITDPKYSIFDYQKDARCLVDKLELPLIVGGSALYIRSLLYDYQLDQDIKRDDTTLSAVELRTLINKLSPDSKIPLGASLRRLSRYYDIVKNGGVIGDAKVLGIYSDYEPLFIYLEIPRNEQKEIFEKRLDKQIEDGFIEEVESINQRLDIIGYAELWDYLKGTITLSQAKEQIINRSLKLAKKQKTFFINQFNMNIFNYNDPHLYEDVIALIDLFISN